MKSPLHILYVEDEPRDAELVQETLEADGIACDITRVETEAQFISSLEQGAFDLILADYTLPSFDGLSALKIASKGWPQVPFIFVAGTLGEDVAIEALKFGAMDYVFKTRLSRLVHSVQRALREADERAELSRADRALQRSEAYLAEAQSLSHTGSFGWNVSTGDIYWSEETFRIFEFEPTTRITLELAIERTHPNDRPAVQHLVETIQRDPQSVQTEYRLLMPEGSIKYIQVVGRPSSAESGVLEYTGAITDITERKLVEQRLRAQHLVTEALAEAATLEEAAPKILRALCESLLWDLGALWRLDSEAGALRCVDVWHNASIEAPQFEAISRERTFMPGRWLPGQVWSSHEPAYIPDVGQDVNFQRGSIAAREGLHSAFGIPILLGREVFGVMEFYSQEIRQPQPDLLDMMATLGSQVGQFIERKRAEDALHHAQTELAHVARVATLGEMTASIAHEINQPLGAVVNNASACLRWLKAHNTDEAMRSAELVIADGHRAGEIISRIRKLARKVPPQKDWIDINDTIREVIALAHGELLSNRVSLKTHFADDLPLISGDRIQLQQVVLNLIMNAVEAMSGNVECSRQLSVGSKANGPQTALVEVRDSGAGLDPKSLDRLFDAFYTTKPSGLGMGLAISRSIVGAHGGRLWAVPNEGRGATFQFTLPTAEETSS
jgi:PAS domain S-box-containing protein